MPTLDSAKSSNPLSLDELRAARASYFGNIASEISDVESSDTESVTSMGNLNITEKPNYSEEATLELLEVLRKIRNRIGKEWEKAEKRSRNISPKDMEVTLTTQEKKEISQLLQKGPDTLQLDKEGYSILLEINHWVRQKALSSEYLKLAIHCHNKQQGLEHYNSDNDFDKNIRSAISTPNPRALEQLLEKTRIENPIQLRALNYIYPINHALEGKSLLRILSIELGSALRNQPNKTAHAKQLQILDLLLKYGANPSIPFVSKDDGRGILHSLTFYANSEAIKILAKHGVNMTQRGCIYRVDPLLYLTMTYPPTSERTTSDTAARFEIMEFFFKQGLSPLTYSAPGPWKWNINAYETAKEKNDLKMIHLIEDFLKQQSPLIKGKSPQKSPSFDTSPPSYQEATEKKDTKQAKGKKPASPKDEKPKSIKGKSHKHLKATDLKGKGVAKEAASSHAPEAPSSASSSYAPSFFDAPPPSYPEAIANQPIAVEEKPKDEKNKKATSSKKPKDTADDKHFKDKHLRRSHRRF